MFISMISIHPIVSSKAAGKDRRVEGHYYSEGVLISYMALS